MNYVIGIDPGKKTGWGIVRVLASPTYLSSGSVELDNKGSKIKSAVELLQLLNVGFFDICRTGVKTVTLAIEGQYVDKNIDTTIKLARSSGRWVEAAAYLNLDHRIVNPSSWQSAELGLKMCRSQVKKLSRLKVQSLYGPLASVSQDDCDAILIARHEAIKIFFGKSCK